MRRFLPLALAICTTLGCNDNNAQSNPSGAIAPELSGATRPSSEVDEFAKRWKDATLEERQRMADLRQMSRLFLGATKEQIKAVFGPPDPPSEFDKFGPEVMRYELGAMPDMDGQKLI